MKRGWIGLALLLVMLAGGLAVTGYMDKTHVEIGELLDSAGTLALKEDWQGADRLLRRAKENWEQHRKFSAALTDHAALEEIDNLLAQLEIYGQQREALSVAALCAQLESRLEDLAEAQQLTWWNVL